VLGKDDYNTVITRVHETNCWKNFAAHSAWFSLSEVLKSLLWHSSMAKGMTGDNITKGTLSSLRFISLQPQLQQAGFAESLPLQRETSRQNKLSDSWWDRALTVLTNRQLLPGRGPVSKQARSLADPTTSTTN